MTCKECDYLLRGLNEKLYVGKWTEELEYYTKCLDRFMRVYKIPYYEINNKTISIEKINHYIFRVIDSLCVSFLGYKIGSTRCKHILKQDINKLKKEKTSIHAIFRAVYKYMDSTDEWMPCQVAAIYGGFLSNNGGRNGGRR